MPATKKDTAAAGAPPVAPVQAGQTASPKIVTEYVYPPIPVRSSDWCAYVDGTDEETRQCGWGATKEAAIHDLRLISEDFPRRCLTNIVMPTDGSCWHCLAAQGETCRDIDASSTAQTSQLDTK